MINRDIRSGCGGRDVVVVVIDYDKDIVKILIHDNSIFRIFAYIAFVWFLCTAFTLFILYITAAEKSAQWQLGCSKQRL